MKIIRYLVIAGNILFMLWITYNGIDEGFKGTIYQQLSYVGLMVLFVLNIYLIKKNS